MRFGSLFTGIGGFDLAFQEAGFDVVYQAEIDGACRRLLAARFPDARIVDDVRLVGTMQPFPLCGEDCDEDFGCQRDPECIGISELIDDYAVDVLAGGFPCQDISAARDRWGAAGLSGERSGLFWEFARVIELSRPDFVIIENTGRLRNGRGGADFRSVLGELARLGYVGLAGILDAAAFGCPLPRPRVFVVACDAREAGGLERGARLAAEFQRYDPGCVVWEGSGQSRSADGDPSARRPNPGSYRLLTPVGAERALGFPDDWTAGFPATTRYHMVGNAVAVPVARWIADRIAAVTS